MKTYTLLCKMRNILHKCFREYQNTRYIQKFFSKNRAIYDLRKKGGTAA